MFLGTYLEYTKTVAITRLDQVPGVGPPMAFSGRCPSMMGVLILHLKQQLEIDCMGYSSRAHLMKKGLVFEVSSLGKRYPNILVGFRARWD